MTARNLSKVLTVAANPVQAIFLFLFRSAARGPPSAATLASRVTTGVCAE